MQFNQNKSFWAVLALARFFLATIVYIAHLQFFINLPPALFSFRELGGKAAVLSFFLISGISIGYSYSKSSHGFLARRFTRIYPLYFFAVVLSIILQSVLGSPYHVANTTFVTAGIPTSIANLLFLQGFLAITITYNGPLWSLAIEVFYYAITPLLAKLKPFVIHLFIIFSFIVYYTCRHQYWEWGFNALKYAWPWLTGFLLAYTRVNKWILITLLSTGIICTYIVLVRDGDGTLSHITFTIIALIVLFLHVKSITLPSLIIKIFNFLGDLSYPLYLFHMPLYLLFYHLAVRNAYAFAGLLLISIVPLNYLLDNLLKRIFWVPLINMVTNYKYAAEKLKFNAKRYLSRS